MFEADCAITSDQVVVPQHDWVSDLGQVQSFGWTEEEKEVPAAELFLWVPIYERYTPMTLLDLYQKMAEKPDIYVVLDRVIVQLYYEDMYDEVESVYSFKNYIYTLYYIGYPGGESVGNFCEEKEISVLVMPYTWLSEGIMQELEQYQIKLYVHTVNELQDMYNMVSLQVDGIYSDQILPGQMKELLDD